MASLIFIAPFGGKGRGFSSSPNLKIPGSPDRRIFQIEAKAKPSHCFTSFAGYPVHPQNDKRNLHLTALRARYGPTPVLPEKGVRS
jgi:hypothetical protein